MLFEGWILLLVEPFLTWLAQGAIGPALVGLPVNWAAGKLAGVAKGWFRRRSDGLSRIVLAATGGAVDLSDAEFDAVRHLLEDERTWIQIGHGTVEDLAVRIASCLPPGAGRSADDCLVVSRAIARGLLEFAADRLEPGLFQQVLLARLDRLETNQASALDEAIMGVHADLAALFAQQDEADADRFERVMRQLGRVLDGIAHGPAGQSEVSVYLARLIRWLNTDQWPHDDRLGGPVLTPAGMERKLTVTNVGQAGGQVLDADEVARHCTRLVVLGGPGAGKTWLARRTARRCAEDAREALAAGASIDEVELPLFTTCSQLLAVPSNIEIRQAIVSSAFGQLCDLGGMRISQALQEFFANRNAPTLLVLDSLDEASGPDDRVARPTRSRLRGGSFSPVGRARGTSSSTSRNEATLTGSARCSRYATRMTWSNSSPAGSPRSPPGVMT